MVGGGPTLFNVAGTLWWGGAVLSCCETIIAVVAPGGRPLPPLTIENAPDKVACASDLDLSYLSEW